MSHRYTYVCITALALAMHAEVAYGDELELSVGAKGGLGWITLGGADSQSQFGGSVPTMGHAYGIDVHVAPISRLALAIDIMRLRKGSGVETIDGTDVGTLDYDYVGGLALANIRILTKGRFIPYVQAGVELGYLLETMRRRPGQDPQDLTDDTSKVDVSVVAGAGLGVRLAKRHEIVLEGRVDVGFLTTDASVNMGETFNRSLMFMAGYRYWLLSSGSESRPARKKPDADSDRVPDVDDKCPNRPEDRDGFQDDDGCPELDNDGDDIADTEDECPNDAEDMDGFEDENGCPDPDNDGDGVPDDQDRCKVEKEDVNDFQDDDGCPDAEDDSDDDLVLDPVDKCLDDTGLYTADGCTKQYEHIKVQKQRVVFEGDKGERLFETRRGKVTDTLDPSASVILDELARALNEHPGIAVLQIDAHTAGKKRKDLQLSQRQAQAIRDYLIEKHGIADKRLVARGHGGSSSEVNPPKSQRRDAIVLTIANPGAE